MQKNKSLHSLLRDIDSTTHLKRIERICSNNPGYGENPLAYFETYYNFRKTLTHAVFNYESDASITVQGQTGQQLLSLPNFERLTHPNAINNHGYFGDLTMDDFSAMCPKLRSLQFISSSTVRNAFDASLKYALGGLKNQVGLWSVIEDNLRELDIHLSTLSSTYIDIITKYPPSRLKKFSVTLSDQDMAE